MRTETIGTATLYLADSFELLANLPRPAAIVTDPPYGQRQKLNIDRVSGRLSPKGGPIPARRQNWPAIVGDDRPFDPLPLLDASDRVLMWGAHRFGDRLPAGRWLAWDKLPTGKIKDQGCGELAWTNVSANSPLRIFRHLWDGLSIASGYETRIERRGGAAARRVHPMQKPVDLMRWCIGLVDVAPGGVICDPFMGGGSTAIASMLTGHSFVGIEVVPAYFDAACRRIETALEAKP